MEVKQAILQNMQSKKNQLEQHAGRFRSEFECAHAGTDNPMLVRGFPTM